MRALPLSIGTIHFVGIGGIGMSGIAEVLHNLGYSVQGSDVADSANVKRIRALGIPVAIGHAAENIGDAAVVVVSSAIKAENPELATARAGLLPVVRRAEMLGELMRLKWSVAVAGTHGKTTTTSLVAAVLEGAGYDPTVINGGIINAYGTNTRLGAGDWMVVEADESDGTFVKLPATIAIVTNIDPEHLDHFGTFDGVKAAFDRFIENIPFYGFAALCIDHPEVQAMIPRVADRRIITYGFSPQADIRAVNVETSPDGSVFDIEVKGRGGDSRTIERIGLSMLGRHNVQNACAAIAVANEMQIVDDDIRAALSRFQGVKRRFTKTGVANGVTVIDDYGHHPVEISAVLRAARLAVANTAGAKVVAVVQPHRYTRLASLFEDFCTCFNDADTVVVADVYPAGEAPIPGVDRDALVAGLQARGHRSVVALPEPAALAGLIGQVAHPGDFVVCLGAGSITNWAASLPGELTALKPGSGAMMAAERLDHGLIDRLPAVRGRLRAGVALAPFTWFRVGGPAEAMFRPADIEDLSIFLAGCATDIPVTVLGVASNLLVRDGGISGVVIRLGGEFARVGIHGEALEAGAGALCLTVAEEACAAGIAGLEFLSGIPGTIGGAVKMNAGAYGREIVDIIESAVIVTREGNVKTIARDALGLTYRHSELPEGAIVVEAKLRGEPGDSAVIAERMRDYQTRRAETQPIRSRTGGSTFANPPGTKAWELIDHAGCRGLMLGGAQVSEQHCNFLINTGTASAADIEGLGEEVRRRVRETSGIELRWEIMRIGEPR